MPTYEYRCLTCGVAFEHVQSMSAPPLKACLPEVCPLSDEMKGTGVVERRISAGTGLVFKGSGFYITDYKGWPASPKGDAAGETKTEGSSAPKQADSTGEPKQEKAKTEQKQSSPQRAAPSKE